MWVVVALVLPMSWALEPNWDLRDNVKLVRTISGFPDLDGHTIERLDAALEDVRHCSNGTTYTELSELRKAAGALDVVNPFGPAYDTFCSKSGALRDHAAQNGCTDKDLISFDAFDHLFQVFQPSAEKMIKYTQLAAAATRAGVPHTLADAYNKTVSAIDYAYSLCLQAAAAESPRHLIQTVLDHELARRYHDVSLTLADLIALLQKAAPAADLTAYKESAELFEKMSRL